MYIIHPLRLDSALHLQDRGFLVNERGNHVSGDKIDLHFACEQRGVVSRECVRSKPGYPSAIESA